MTTNTCITTSSGNYLTNLQGSDNCWPHSTTLNRPQSDNKPFLNTSTPSHKYGKT